MSTRENSLIVFFPKEKAKLLESWKRYYTIKNGFGCIKKRVIEMVEDDFNENCKEFMEKVNKLK